MKRSFPKSNLLLVLIRDISSVKTKNKWLHLMAQEPILKSSQLKVLISTISQWQVIGKESAIFKMKWMQIFMSEIPTLKILLFALLKQSLLILIARNITIPLVLKDSIWIRKEKEILLVVKELKSRNLKVSRKTSKNLIQFIHRYLVPRLMMHHHMVPDIHVLVEWLQDNKMKEWIVSSVVRKLSEKMMTFPYSDG